MKNGVEKADLDTIIEMMTKLLVKYCIFNGQILKNKYNISIPMIWRKLQKSL